jgi:hypothetical protein
MDRNFIEFIAELAGSLHPNSVLDPWVAEPAVLAAVQDATSSQHGCGLVYDTAVWEISRLIAEVDWRHGDPFRLLDNLTDERFDLLLVSPALGVRLPVNRQAGDPPGAVELADLVLWRAAPLVADRGHIFFHTADSFFEAETRRHVRQGLSKRGLHPCAVVSVDGALAPRSHVATSLVVFRREPSDQLFVGRLESGTPRSRLAQNLLEFKTADDPQLGVLTAADTFRGWRQLIREREVAELFGSYELRGLSDIGSIRVVNLRPDRLYEAPPNCVFVPTLGFGNVTTVPPDLEGRSGYRLLEVKLDPAVARAAYVAGLLSIAAGKQLRESIASGSTIPHVTASGIGVLRIPLPPIVVQESVARSAAHLSSMEATIARLRTELWRHPDEAQRVISRLEAAAKADPVRRWLETLPYPLASILQHYTAQRDPLERVDRLLHFFEATAQFACAVLLSILHIAPELLDSAKRDIANAAGPNRELFDRADFGLWINLGSTLAKAIRRLFNTAEHRIRLEQAAAPSSELMQRLADKPIWQVLDRARSIRNARAHGGVTSKHEMAGWLGTLELLLSDAEQALGTGFDIDLVRADQGRFRGGLHIYPSAQRLRGPSGVFEEFEVRTRVPLESEHLAFVDLVPAISSVLKIIPLVRVGPSASTSRNACYFFESRLKTDLFSYVSYHFEDQPRIQVFDHELEEFVRELRESRS